MAKNKIQTFIFMDCESTGLPQFECNVKITELTLIAILSDHLMSKYEKLPRVSSKLTLYFNPQKLISVQASKITGLSNELLEHHAPFTSSTVEMLNAFIMGLPQPACFVAHNGINFDYPLLQKHTQKVLTPLQNNLLCIDTLILFRHAHTLEMERMETQLATLTTDTEAAKAKIPEELMDDDWDDLISQTLDKLDSDAEFIARMTNIQRVNETTPKKSKAKGDNGSSNKSQPTRKKLNFGNIKPKFNLKDLYERRTGLEASDCHQSEYDVFMMVRCAASLGEQFLTLANEMAFPFRDIQALKN